MPKEARSRPEQKLNFAYERGDGHGSEHKEMG